MRKVLPPLLALIVGLAVGWLLPRPAGAPVPEQIIPVDQPEPVAKDDPKPPPSPKPTPVPQVDPTPVQPVANPLPLPPVSKGDGRAECSVSRADGSPFPGLSFRAVPIAPSVASMLERYSIEQRLAYQAELLRWQAEAAREAESGADGAVVFTGLGDGRYLVHGLTPGVQVRSTRGATYLEISAGKGVQMVAVQVREVAFKVLMPDKSEPDAAVIQLRAEGAAGTTGRLDWRPDNRVAEAGIGRHRATATRGLAKAEANFEVPATGDVPEVELRFELGKGLTIKLEKPKPCYDQVEVVLLTAADAARALAPTFQPVPPRTIAFTVTSGASYFYEGLSAGEYVAFARAGIDDRLIARLDIAVTGESQEVTFTVPPLDPAEHLIVHVLDPQGLPRDGVLLFVSLVEPDGAAVAGSAVRISLGEGRYWVRKPGLAADWPGRASPEATNYVITARDGGLGAQVARVPVAVTGEIEIRFSGRTNLRVEASNLPKTGLDGLWLAVVPTESGENGPIAVTRANGRLPTLSAVSEFRNLQSGPATLLLVRQAGYPQSELVLMRREIVLLPGEQTLPLRLPDLHRLAVRHPDSADAYPHIHGAGMEIQGKPVVAGVVTIENLPAGTYQIEWMGAWMSVTLPHEGVIDFKPMPPNCIVITGYDRAGKIHATGLRKGDVIVSISGERAEGNEALGSLLRAAAGKPSVELEVSREGRIERFTVAGDLLTKAEETGGRFAYRRN